MPSFRFVGGAQQPDLFGYVEPGDVLDLDEQPDVGQWEPVTAPPPTQPPAPVTNPPPSGPTPAQEA